MRQVGRVLFTIGLALLSASASAQTVRKEATGKAAASALQAKFAASSGMRLMVDTGEIGEASLYYDRIQKLMKFDLVGPKPNYPFLADLTKLLNHFGYSITAADLEKFVPGDLMSKLPNGVLAARFFAPKIVDYSGTLDPSSGQFRDVRFDIGWRKLVRLNAITGSGADAAGLASMTVLFNYVQKLAEIAQDPFDNKISKNNQVIITFKDFTPGTSDSALFLVFDEGTKGYKLISSLQGVAFDLPEFSGGGNYFVPRSCAQCHGVDRTSPGSIGPFPLARLNYLDTDHWFDAAGYDFPDLVKSSHGVLFDGSKDTSSAQFKQAFDVLRQLNKEILAHNEKVALGSPISADEDFKTKAVKKWVDLHSANEQHVAPIDRALAAPPKKPGVPEKKAWSNNPDEVELLTRLNRYCFRCHSSIKFGVFARWSIPRFGQLVQRLSILPNDKQFGKNRMPQGRILEPAELQKMKDYLNRIPQ